MRYEELVKEQEDEPSEVSRESFLDWRQRRPLFVDELEVASPYLLFRVRPKGSLSRPHYSSDIEYVVSLEFLVSAVRSANVVTFSDYLVFTYEQYGKEWFVLRVV